LTRVRAGLFFTGRRKVFVGGKSSIAKTGKGEDKV